MEREGSYLLCIFCCKYFRRNYSLLEDEQEDSSKIGVEAIKKFFGGTRGVIGEISGLSAPLFLEGQMSLCGECLIVVESCNERGEQLQRLERDVRRLQLVILRMMRELEGVIGGYEEEMGVVERIISGSEDTRLSGVKRRKGRQKGGTWNKENVRQFRDEVLKGQWLVNC